MQCPEQIRQTFLTGDATDEQQRRFGAVDVVTVEHLPAGIVIRRGLELAHGDAIVHHDHLVRIEIRVGRKNVLAHAGGHGDDPIGMLVGVLLRPGAQIVSAAKLLALPRPEGLKRMRGDDQWRVMQHLGKIPGKTCVPRMCVDNIGIDVVGHLQIDTERLQGAVRVPHFLRHVIADDLEGPLRIGARDLGNIGWRAWAVERPDGHIDPFRQHFGKLLHMYSSASVHLGRVFAG